MIGIIVLVLGIGGAGVVYWLGTRSPDVSDDLSMLGYNKAQMRQMGMLYGKMGPVIEEWFDDLKQPGTQAEIIVVISVLIAAGCFYFAPWLNHDDKTD
jgi:flagellar basal body-associated protein FliL